MQILRPNKNMLEYTDCNVYLVYSPAVYYSLIYRACLASKRTVRCLWAVHIYVFENVVPSDTGYLNNLFFETIKTKTKTINVPGLKSNSKVMVFVNGLLISNSDIASIQNDKINFKNELKVNDWVNVTEIVEGIAKKKNLEIIYDGC